MGGSREREGKGKVEWKEWLRGNERVEKEGRRLRWTPGDENGEGSEGRRRSEEERKGEGEVEGRWKGKSINRVNP